MSESNPEQVTNPPTTPPTPPTPPVTPTTTAPTDGARSGPPETLKEEWTWYVRQWPGLLAGKKVPTYPIGATPYAVVGRRSEADHRLLLDIATRQLASLDTQLEQVRQRAQFLFTTLLATTALASLVLRSIFSDRGVSVVFASVAWGLAVLTLVAALLGTAGVIVNSKTMGIVSAPWLSRQSDDWLLAVTNDAVSATKYSEETVANQLTYFRHAALLTMLGTLLLCLSWILSAA